MGRRAGLSWLVVGGGWLSLGRWVIGRAIPALTVVYAAIAAVFGIGALCLVGLAAVELWQAVAPGTGAALPARAAAAIESIGLITVALMSRDGTDCRGGRSCAARAVSAPTRVRRYVSRFLGVVVVALSIESLVGVVEALHRNPRDLPHAAGV